jgi:hypothetical protein
MVPKSKMLVHAIRGRLWYAKTGHDALIFAQNHQIKVHTSIIASESPYLNRMFEQSAQSGGRRTYYVHSVDVHTVLRTLELIYLGAYSYHLEKTEIPGKIFLHLTSYSTVLDVLY